MQIQICQEKIQYVVQKAGMFDYISVNTVSAL